MKVTVDADFFYMLIKNAETHGAYSTNLMIEINRKMYQGLGGKYKDLWLRKSADNPALGASYKKRFLEYIGGNENEGKNG